MADDPVLEQPQPKTRGKRINYALAGTLVASGVTLEDAAKQSGAKNANTLGSGMRRKGVTVKAARALPYIGERNTSVTLRLVNQASEVLKADMHRIVQAQVNKLKGSPNDDKIQSAKAVGDALEPLARTAKIVHGWGNDEAVGLVRPGRYTEIEATCVPEATTGSVPAKALLESTPQDAEAIESKPATEQGK